MKKKTITLMVFFLLLCIGVVLFHIFQPKPALTVYSQGDYIDPRVLQSFTRSTGIKVEYRRIDTAAGELRPTDCDLLLADVELLARMNECHLLITIDCNNLSDRAQFSPAYFSQTMDQTGGCAVPCLWTTMGLLFDPTHTNTRVTGWDALFDREFAGQVAMTSRYRDAVTLALAADGRSIDSSRPEDMVAADRLLDRQCPVGYFDGTDLAPVFRSNAAVLAPCYAREAISLMEEMPELTFVIPSEGNWHTMLAYAIPVRSTERTAAYALLDFLCQPSNLARNSIYSGWSTPSSPAFSLLDPKLQQNPLLYPGGRHMTGDLLPATKFRSFQKGCRLNWPPEPVS